MIPGLQFGRYEVGELIGKGGFGVVHLARDVELGRELAIKFLRPEYLTRSQIVQRFLQEARAAAKIGHPGIVLVFDCGLVSGAGRHDGTAYIAMERLQGESLGDRLVEGKRFALASVIALARQLAAALAAAHAAGIVHRDLKPDNVFLIRDSAVVGGERAKILDFGIAKLAEPGPGGVHTHSQMILGTPRYMSPEQARSAAKADTRSDIYALGCMLYELVCGRPPFDGDAGDVMLQHQTTAPARPSELMDNVPSELDDLIVAMLAKTPEDRPATMAAVDEALARVPVTADASVILDPVPREKPKFVARPVITSVVEPPPPSSPRRIAALASRESVEEEEMTVPRHQVGVVDTPVDPPPRSGPRPAPMVAAGSIIANERPAPKPASPPRLVDMVEGPTTGHTLAIRRLPKWTIAYVAAGMLVIIAIVAIATREQARPELVATDAAPAALVVEPRVTPDATAREDIDWIVAQCETAKADRNWQALERCGRGLLPHAKARAEDYLAIAARENRAQQALRAVTDALAAGDRDLARMHARTIPGESSYLVEAIVQIRDADAAVPDPAIDAGPPVIVERPARVEANEPPRACDPDVLDELETKGDRAMTNGTFAVALATFELILECKRPDLTLKAYLAACRAHRFPRAKQLFAKLAKESYAQICMKEGFDPRR